MSDDTLHDNTNVSMPDDTLHDNTNVSVSDDTLHDNRNVSMSDNTLHDNTNVSMIDDTLHDNTNVSMSDDTIHDENTGKGLIEYAVIRRLQFCQCFERDCDIVHCLSEPSPPVECFGSGISACYIRIYSITRCSFSV